MVSANVIKGVNELVEQVTFFSDEHFGDAIARGLNISNQQSETLLRSLHDGATTQGATAIAGFDPALTKNDVLAAIARAIGVTTTNLRDQ